MPGAPPPTVYRIEGEVEDFKRAMEESQAELARLKAAAEEASGGLTELQKAQRKAREATKAFGDAQKQATAEARRRLEVGRAIVKATREAEKANRAAAAAETKRAQELKQGLNAVLGDQVNKVSEVANAFGTSGLAIVAGVGIGIGALKAFSAITTTTLGTVEALGEGVVDLIREMEDYSVEVNEANDAMDAAAAVAGVFKGELATELAPEVERTAKLLAALGLAGVEGFEVLAGNANVALEVVSRLGSLGIRPTTELMLSAVEASTALSRSLGIDIPEAVDMWVEQQRLANSGLDVLINGASNAEDALGGYLVQVDQIIEAQRIHEEETEAAKEATKRLAEEQKFAAKVAREQAAAQKALADVFRGAQDAVNALADSRATEAELLVQQALEAERAAEVERDAAIRLGADRVQAEAAAAVEIQAIREKLRDDIEAIELEQFETSIDFVDQEVDAALDAQRERSEALLEARQQFNEGMRILNEQRRDEEIEAARQAAEEQQAIAEALRDTLIGIANDVTMALIEGASNQRDAWISAEQERVESSIAALEMREDLSGKELDLLERLEADKARLALLDFRRGKAVAAGQAIVNGALLAVSASLPPPAGIGFPAGLIAAGATTGAQLAIIAAQSPPSFHQGLDDQFQATLQRGEEVATAAGVRRNPGVVGAMNRGASVTVDEPGSGRSWGVFIDGEEQARSTVRQLDEDGPLRVQIADQSPGMSSGYGRRR